MITDVEKVIREYLPGVLHMSLATCKDNKPWVCEVHFVYDKNLNIYFRSKKSRRHSQEIKENPYVAGNIVEQHELPDKPQGVYFEGKAEIVDNRDEINTIVPKFVERLRADNFIADDAMTEDGHKIYRIHVNKYYLFDSRESNPSQKYELEWDK